MIERGCEHHEGARPFMATTACLKTSARSSRLTDRCRRGGRIAMP